MIGLELDPALAGSVAPLSANLIGADQVGSKTFLVFDRPVDLLPPGPPTRYVPGQVVSWDGTGFALVGTLAGWPPGSLVDALSFQANPGAISAGIGRIRLSKAAFPDIVIDQSDS